MKNLAFLILFICNVCNAQKEEIKTYIAAESITGGKLDFTKFAEEQAHDAPFIRYGNTLYNKKDFAILMWSIKVRSLGIEKIEDANSLWEKIHNKPLTEPEKRALKTGFEIKLDN